MILEAKDKALRYMNKHWLNHHHRREAYLKMSRPNEILIEPLESWDSGGFFVFDARGARLRPKDAPGRARSALAT